MPERIYEQIGLRIRAVRKSRELSLEALADRTGLTSSYLGQVERVERKPSLLTLGKIATALDVSPASFYATGTESMVRQPESAWARRVFKVLEGLSVRNRAIVWDTMMFMIRRLRLER
jgi:transcriptional regulator with XRE-family HTH domain